MIVELRFPAGRYHATAWGRHVNEGVPEWPPSPFRILRALVDAWHRKHDDIAASAVESVLRALAAAPPLYRLPPARGSHTRGFLSQNKEDLSDKKLVFDAFAVLDKDAKVLVGWLGARLGGDLLQVARKLFSSLNYLGRSESWVVARVIDDRAVAWNCAPLVEGVVAESADAVNVASVVTPNVYDQRPFEVPAKGKVRARRLPWMEALSWGSAEAITHTMNRPPAMEPTLYARPKHALDARPPARVQQSRRLVDVIRFAVDGKVRAPITDAVMVAEQIRRNLMGSLKRVTGDERLSVTFSGKDAEGRPVRGHPHASILPLDADGNGFIDTILITSDAIDSFRARSC